MAVDTLLREPTESSEEIEGEGGQDERKLARLSLLTLWNRASV
jgi:hypothetical protein